MANFRVWIEETRAGSLLVRHHAPGEKKQTDYCIGKAERMTIDGEDLTGRGLAKLLKEKVSERYYKRELGDCDLSGSLETDLAEFLQQRETDRHSPYGINHNRNSLTPFLRDLNLKVRGDITNEKIRWWKQLMTSAGLANATIRGRLADVRTFLNWLKEHGKIKESPFGLKMMPKKRKAEPRYYTALEFQALDKAMAAINPYAHLAINLAHDAGLRKIEIVGDGGLEDRLGVTWEDITWLGKNADGQEQADLLLRREVVKGGARSRTVPLSPGLIRLLGSRRSGPLIPLTRCQLDHRFIRARKLAGLEFRVPEAKKLTIHGLRHTFAKNYLQHGAGNLKSLQDLLGHLSITSTEIYAQFEKSYYREGINRAYERRMQDGHGPIQEAI